MSNLPPLFNIQPLLPYCENQALILTPNNRLRSKVLQAWGQYQQSQGNTVWQSPRIEVIGQWFSQQWQQLQAQAYTGSSQTIISAEQQRVIWESITADCGLMQTEAIAKQAASAFTTLVLWNQSVDRSTIDHNINKQFRQWIHSFKQQLNSLNSITPEDSYRIIGQAFEQAQLTPEPSIHLLGFDDIAPLVEEQLNKATPSLQRLPSPSHQPNSLQRLQFDSPEAEMQAAAQWARKLVENANTDTATPVRIGIITPNLGQCREQVEFAFTAEFEAHSFSPSTERYTLPFNISAGTPLGSTPLINSALNLLKLNNKQWDTSYIESVLLSPFWGKYSTELPLRCALIERLKRAAVFTINGSTLRYEAERIDQQYQAENNHNTHDSNSGIYPYFYALYTQQTAPNSLLKQSKHYPSVWVTLFLEHLDLLNWPGERTPDSQEYQQTQLWHQLLENLARLDSVLGAIDHSSAVAQLQNMANALPFQPKVPDSPIQILGILEGAGLHFTHCWIMGLHQKAWPPAPAPNSLLPISLQRDLNMPHASSLRELQYAQSLTDNYRHCADHIIFSTPIYLNDSEQALPPSQLIADIPLGALTLTPANDSLNAWNEQLQNSIALNTFLEIVPCDTAPAYIDTLIAGGTGVLTAQSANPFDSFAKYRLKASSPDQAVNGFSSGEKGNILHNALAIIWGELKDHNGLISQSENELAQLIHNSVTSCINDIRKHKFDHLSTALCEIECERQSLYISQWLNTEKSRSPFTVVAIEEDQTIHFEGKTFSIRIDRVDQLQDGSFLIIDYKTGSPSLSDWKGERPKEPQLPLYALTYSRADKDTNNVRGISFAQINAKDQKFIGAGAANLAQGIPSLEKNRSGLPKTWEDAKAQWQQALSQLITEYCNGNTAVKYRDNNALSQAQDYNKEILRLNRFYEAKDIARLIEASQQGAAE